MLLFCADYIPPPPHTCTPPHTALYILYTALMAVRVCSQECDSEGGPRVMCYTHNILNKGARSTPTTGERICNCLLSYTISLYISIRTVKGVCIISTAVTLIPLIYKICKIKNKICTLKYTRYTVCDRFRAV